MCIRRTLVGNTFKHRGHSLTIILAVNRDKIAYFHKKCGQFLTGGGVLGPQTPPPGGFAPGPHLGHDLCIPILASHFKWPSAAPMKRRVRAWREGFVKQVGLQPGVQRWWIVAWQERWIQERIVTWAVRNEAITRKITGTSRAKRTTECYRFCWSWSLSIRERGSLEYRELQ